MNTAKDGGSAFPLIKNWVTDPSTGPSDDGREYTGVTKFEPGMSLRDWFAGMVLNAMLANPYTGEQLHESYKNFPSEELEAGVVRAAYRTADAMLKARANTPEPH